jgi:dTDP-4-amino-4,6-dideoxygalactose transaminase
VNDWRVGLTEISLPDSDVEAVLETLRSGWLTMGPRTQELEEAFRATTGSEHAVAVSSGTAALHLACLAAGVGPGDEVIAPGLSFVADAHAGRCAGGDVVLADCRSVQEPLLDPEQVERRMTDRTKAVIAVHMFGYPADADALRELCEPRGVALIEDCAEADGGKLRDGSPAGTVGICGCFSFFSKTQLGVGEGGILVTDDEAFAHRLRALRSHAMTSVTWDRHRGHAETYDVTDLGFNYRIDEPRASLAHARLARLDDALSALRRVARAYRERLTGMERVEVPFRDEWVDLSGHFAFPVLVADAATRDSVRQAMHAAGVQTTFYPALTQLSAYEPSRPDGAMPLAEEFADRHLALPLSPSLDDKKLDLVVEELGRALDSYSGRAVSA